MEDQTMLMCCGYRRVRGGEEREVHEDRFTRHGDLEGAFREGRDRQG